MSDKALLEIHRIVPLHPAGDIARATLAEIKGNKPTLKTLRKTSWVMPRYIIECDDPSDIILGMKAIKALIRSELEHGCTSTIVAFEDDSIWYVRKTKTGYSARTAGKT